MTKHHLRFRNFHPRTVDAAKALFDAKPWRSDSEQEQIEIGQAFLKEIASTYDIPNPVLTISEYSGGEYFQYEPQEIEVDSLGSILSSRPPSIIMHHWSILNLLFAARVHQVESSDSIDATDEMDGFGWACSLFYLVKPAMFRARVREGRILEVTVRDLYSTASWNKLEEAGVTNGNDLLVSKQEATAILNGSSVSEIEAFANGQIEEQGGDGLEGLNITELRQLSRGVFSGGYSLRKPELIAKLREHGVRS